jgi:hypothetical protein
VTGAANQRLDDVWNPTTIAWLGIPFSPLWAGWMATVNGGRLDMLVSPWKPLLVGAGSLATAVILKLLFFRTYFAGFVLYAMAIIPLWWSDLRFQSNVYKAHIRQGVASARWPLPCILGGLAAPLLIWLLVIYPSLPTPPREVCRYLIEFPPESQMQRLTTNNLREAVSTLALLKASGQTQNLLFELTDEAPLTYSGDGYLVGCRVFLKNADLLMKFAGLFYLVKLEGAWKVEDVYLVSMKDKDLPDWLALSEHHKLLPVLLPKVPQPMPSLPQSEAASQPPKLNPLWDHSAEIIKNLLEASHGGPHVQGIPKPALPKVKLPPIPRIRIK